MRPVNAIQAQFADAQVHIVVFLASLTEFDHVRRRRDLSDGTIQTLHGVAMVLLAHPLCSALTGQDRRKAFDVLAGDAAELLSMLALYIEIPLNSTSSNTSAEMTMVRALPSPLNLEANEVVQGIRVRERREVGVAAGEPTHGRSSVTACTSAYNYVRLSLISPAAMAVNMRSVCF